MDDFFAPGLTSTPSSLRRECRGVRSPLKSLFAAVLWSLLGSACVSDRGDDDDVLVDPEPVRVFLMAGQSNMEGYGPLTDQGTGDWPLSDSLEALIASGEESEGLLEKRDDAWVHFDSELPVNPPGLLEPGFGAGGQFFGPELGIGHLLGEAGGPPVVMFKSAVGGTTLGGDWRPPTAVAESGGSVGPLYEEMTDGFAAFREGALQESFPEALEERGYEVAAFVWLQGWNDQFEDGFVAQYEDNLVALVTDVRESLNLPGLRTLVVEGPTLDQELRDARLAAIDRLEASQPGETVLIETEDLVEEEVEGNFHFHFSASNYLEVGRRIGSALQ